MNWIVFGAQSARVANQYGDNYSRYSATNSFSAKRATVRRIAFSLVATLALSASAVAQTWTGTGTSWNIASDWFPVGIPNSATADVNFTGNGAFYAANISSSVSARSLSFSNPTLGYSLTSNTGVSLSNVKEINVAAGVTAVQSINLANVATGSLRFPTGSDLTITNNSTAAGTTLVIGPTTVIGTPGFGGVTVDSEGTTQISGPFAAPGTGNAVVGGLTKYGSGTLILAPPAGSTYTGGTYVYEGTLILGTGTALSTGSYVSVNGFFNDSELNIGNVSNTAATFVDQINVSDGTFRVPSGNGDYYVRTLDMSDAIMDFTGSSNFWLHVGTAGVTPAPGIYVDNGPVSTRTTKWIGSGTSRIQNDNTSPLPIQVYGNAINGIELDAGIILSSGGNNPTFIKEGDGTMRLTNPGNTANINIEAGKLRVDNVAHLGSGVITVNGGTLQYGGDGETTTKNFTIDGTANIQVSTPGANLNYNGVMSQVSFANLHLLGPGAGKAPSTLSLNINNSYYGNTTIDGNAILATPTLNNIGDASPIGSNLFSTGIVLGSSDSRGTMLLTGTSPAYSTNRKVTLNGLYVLDGGGAIGVQNANTNLTWSGLIAGSGSLIKTNAGTVILGNASNSYAGGTLIEGGQLHVANDAALGSSGVRVNAGGILRYTTNATVGRSILLDGGTLEAPSGITIASAGGTLQGEGTALGNVANSGFVEPNDSMGTGLLRVEGNYSQSSSGTLYISADLFLPPGNNPKLEVTGDVALGGTLYMNLSGGVGQFRGTRSFDILDWGGSLNGTTFSTLQLELFGGAFTWDTSQLYTSGVLILTGPPLEGDYNLDNAVNAADYTLWRDTLGSTTNLAANGNGNSDIDLGDYTVWKQNFGVPSGSGAGAASFSTAVPEPATLLLLVVGMLPFTFRRAAVS